LIQDTRTTPFNIGRRIELNDFTEAEAAPLAFGLNHPPSARDTETLRRAEEERGQGSGLVSPRPSEERASRASGAQGRLRDGGGSGGEGGSLLARILYWTGGHPYLTQRLCRALAETLTPDTQHLTPALVDRLCEELFLTRKARETDDNLTFVRNRML